MGSSSEPVELERAEREVLAAVIDRRHGEIVCRWIEVVSSDLDEPHFDPAVLTDALGDYLVALAGALRQGDALSRSAQVAWSAIAREHALTRVRLGFNIDQLVREFVLLRRVLSAVVREEGLPSGEVQSERIADLIEAAIAVSVRSYVDSRDFSARRTQAEHIAFLTHELRNPLGAATLAASQIRRLGPLSPLQQHTLELLCRSHFRIRDLIDKVLATERFETGKVELHPVDTTVGQILQRALVAAEEIARAKRLSFRVDYNPTIRLRTDPVLTASAVQNLVENAVKFTDEGEVSVAVEDAPATVIFHVHDDCTGISDEDQRLIFEPFRRGHAGRAATGLGLAIARHAVEAQGGTIHVESSPGSGCHFWFILPKEGRIDQQGAEDGAASGRER